VYIRPNLWPGSVTGNTDRPCFLTEFHDLARVSRVVITKCE
jgi:hypothetical protein